MTDDEREKFDAIRMNPELTGHEQTHQFADIRDSFGRAHERRITKIEARS